MQQVRSVIENFEKLVLKYPDASSISPHLLSLGVADFRAYTSDGFTILYQHVEPVNESKQAIVAAVFCSQKQDLPRLLIDYCLIYK